MKPLTLQVEAFGPYLERTTIDFEKLNEAGLFLITGSTGGGKTTLLDAMCIALYNRSTGGRRSFADMRCLTADNTQRTEVTFTFSLGDAQYRFHRALFMRKKRGSEVYDLHEQHECAKRVGDTWELQASGAARNVTEYAQTLLSLTAEQFSQVIVLPQGEFLRLLRANSKDKGEILKTLFACESWKTLVTKLGDRQKALYGKRQNSEAMLRSLLEKHSVNDAAELAEQIGALQKKQLAMQADLEEKNKAAAKAQQRLERALAFAQLNKEKTAAAAQVKTAAQQLADAETTMASAPDTEKKLADLQTKLLETERTAQTLRHERERSLERGTVENSINSHEAKIKKLAEDCRTAETARAAALKSIETGEAYIAEITQAAEALPALLSQKTQLEADLKNAQEHRDAMAEVTTARKTLEAKKDTALREKLTVSAQDKAVAAAEATRMANSAAALAAGLSDGSLCPVCGSIHHPAPAHTSSETVTEAELNAMRKQLEKLRAAHTAAESAVSAAQAKLDIAQERLEKAIQACAGAPKAIPELQAALETLQNQITAAEKKTAHGSAARKKLQTLREQANTAEQNLSALNTHLTAARAELEQLRQQMQSFENVRDVRVIDQTLAELQHKAQTLNAQRKTLDDALRSAAENLAAAKKLTAAAKDRLTEAEKALAQFGDAPELSAEESSAAVDAIQKEVRALSVSLGSMTEALHSARSTADTVEKLCAENAELDAEYSRITRLHGLLSGQKNSLRMPILQYVLSMMLEETVFSANRYFSVFSRGRYALRRMTAPKSGSGYSGLDIEVLDGMSGTCRSIETLSGGEQFLASLSLAFGLSEVVQANSGVVRMDSIFIDEGFGSLDGDTLDTAMKALETIRQSGRVVGIISHVSELRHRIPTMIRVSHRENGSAKATVISE